MKIAQLIPGTGSFYCGNCLRESAIARSLRGLGHEVTMVPLYLPLYQEEPGEETAPEVFLGGINMYLSQKAPLLHRLPKPLTRWLDRPGVLRWSSTKGDMTDAAKHADMTIAMLRADDDFQREEVGRLIRWFKDHETPEVICLTNVLLAGLAPLIKRELDVPVVSTLHGEDTFLDALPPPQREQAWALLQERMTDLDAVIPVSDYYGEQMRERLGLAVDRMHRIHNGIDLGDIDFEHRRESGRTTKRIGYLARMCADKGLHTLVDAFIELHKRGLRNACLDVVGVQLKPDRAFVGQLEAKLEQAGCRDRVTFYPNVSRERKHELLQELDVFSVPATYGESFGLYVIEAMAHGVPVVQPRHAAFPELLQHGGGGLLCEPDDAVSLADAIERILSDDELAERLGNEGREAVRTYFNAERMAREVADVYTLLTQRHSAANDSPAATCQA